MVNKSKENQENTLALRGWINAPVFIAKPINKEREFIVKYKNPITDDISIQKWTIGIDNPLTKNTDRAKIVTRSLTIDHAAIIFGILTFADPFIKNSKIRFSLNKLCELVYGGSTPATYEKAKTLLDELLYCWTRIEYENNEAISFRILKNVDVLEKKKRSGNKNSTSELWLESVELNENFMELIYSIETRANIKISHIKQLSSPLARTIYMYLPSKVKGCEKTGDTYKIKLSTLLNDIAYPIPPKKSLIKQLFTQNKNSVLSQLDGAELFYGGYLRCKIKETKDKNDWLLVAWTESTAPNYQLPHKKSKLYTAFIKGGGTPKLWKEKMYILPTIDFNYYFLDGVENMNLDWHGSKRFLLMCKVLMGSKFEEYFGIVKNHIIEDKEIRKTEMALLNKSLITAIENGNIEGIKNDF